MEDAPKVLGHAFISKWAVGLGRAVDTIVWGGYLQSGGNKNYEHIHNEAT